MPPKPRTHTQTHIGTNIHTCTHISTHAHRYTHIRAHPHPHPHTPIDTYTHTFPFAPLTPMASNSLRLTRVSPAHLPPITPRPPLGHRTNVQIMQMVGRSEVRRQSARQLVLVEDAASERCGWGAYGTGCEWEERRRQSHASTHTRRHTPRHTRT